MAASSMMKMSSDFCSGEDTSAEFIQLSSRIKEFGHLAGVTLIPFQSQTLPYFSKMPSEKKSQVLFSMKSFVHICEVTLANGGNLSDTKAFTWHALKEMGMRFNSDIFTYINDSDLLEVYTNDNIQIFRNFRFLELISYTLEDIFCRPWTELFDHKDIEKAGTILKTVQKYSTRECVNTVSLEHMGHYGIQEALSPFRFQYDYVIKYASPLLDSNRHPIGYILIEAAEIVSPIMDRPQRDHLLREFYDNNKFELIG